MTYIPSDFLTMFKDFVISSDDDYIRTDEVRARVRDYSLLSIIKILYTLRGGELSFSNLYQRSRIRMKRSYLNYIDLCISYSMITKQMVGSNMMYKLSDKGRLLLDLFMREQKQICL